MKRNDVQIGGHSSRQAVIERPAVVACGNEHTAAISSRGELFTWGLAGNGELGRVHWQPADAATPQAAHSLHCMRMVSVAAGANHTLAISEVPPLPDRTPAGRSRRARPGPISGRPNLDVHVYCLAGIRLSRAAERGADGGLKS